MPKRSKVLAFEFTNNSLPKYNIQRFFVLSVFLTAFLNENLAEPSVHGGFKAKFESLRGKNFIASVTASTVVVLRKLPKFFPPALQDRRNSGCGS